MIVPAFMSDRAILYRIEEKITEAVKAAGMELLEVTRQNDWVSVTARKR